MATILKSYLDKWEKMKFILNIVVKIGYSN